MRLKMRTRDHRLPEGKPVEEARIHQVAIQVATTVDAVAPAVDEAKLYVPGVQDDVTLPVHHLLLLHHLHADLAGP